MAARFARGSKRVPAIAGLGQCVGTKARTYFAGNDLVDDRGIRPIVEVIYQLGALVTEKAGVSKSRRSFHITNLVVIL